MKKILGFVVLGMVWGLMAGLCLAKGTEAIGTKTIEPKVVKPKLLCKTIFEEEIEGFSVSNDGRYTVVWSEVISRDPITFKREISSKLALLDSTGEKIWEYCIDKSIGLPSISPNGDFVLADFCGLSAGEKTKIHLLNKKGELLWEKYGSGWPTVISPLWKYVLITVFNPDFTNCLQVYNIKGDLLWEYMPESNMYASFVSDNEIIGFEKEGKISLFKADSGLKLWEKDLKNKGMVEIGNLIASGNKNIAITGFEDPTVYVLSKDNGEIYQKYNIDTKYCVDVVGTKVRFLNNDKFFIVLDPQENLLFYNNQTGELLWQKRFISGAQIDVLPNDKHFLVRGSLCKEVKTESKEIKFEPGPYNAYIFNQNSDILWRSNIDGSLKFLDNGEFLIIQKNKKAISLFNATSLIKEKVKEDLK